MLSAAGGSSTSRTSVCTKIVRPRRSHEAASLARRSAAHGPGTSISTRRSTAAPVLRTQRPLQMRRHDGNRIHAPHTRVVRRPPRHPHRADRYGQGCSLSRGRVREGASRVSRHQRITPYTHRDTTERQSVTNGSSPRSFSTPAHGPQKTNAEKHSVSGTSTTTITDRTALPPENLLCRGSGRRQQRPGLLPLDQGS